jgi:thymidine kinase
MHGGVKVYRGAPTAARNYLDADRSRADDYYLSEGSGVARRFTAGPDGPIRELAPLAGDAYEAWVAGVDPETGLPRGRLRQDGHAVRFVEVIVNGPKSWSLVAELHPDIAAAYAAAQDRAASQIIDWLGQHMTTRVGPRGAQVAVPVERLEAVTVRHYTSRAGDPHRHVHLQINARVFAAGRWRGVDTIALRDSIGAINGIGHTAVVCDPDFRTALAAHGYTVADDGEVEELAEYVGPFSRRAAQIGANIDRYEADWRREHPGSEPGPAQWRAWDARAWSDARPDKVGAEPGEQLHDRWLAELAALGYGERDRPIRLAPDLPGQLDRDTAAGEVLDRLGAIRSAWNPADVRGEVEQLLARHGFVIDAAVRIELAEDLTARALRRCVPLLEKATPDHVRALTSRHVLDAEADIVARLAARGAEPIHGLDPGVTVTANEQHLDPSQTAALAALSSTAALMVVEGAAGAGKTTLLAAAREQLDLQGRRLLVVTPTLKAAKAAAEEVGIRAGSAAWLAYQHGWRWDDAGRWSRLGAGEVDPVTGRVYRGAPEDAQLRASDVLLVDEAGMLDQDTAHALLAIADQHAARVALLGDRHQLPAVGRGGVLDLAHRWADPVARVDLDVVHRFVLAVDGTTVPDEEYAALSLAMRTGEDPAAVFDKLHARGQIQLHTSEQDRQQAIADEVAAAYRASRSVVVVVDTREQAATLNAMIRDRRVAAALVDDTHATSTGTGQRIGAGDLIATRRNDRQLNVANRDSWTVTRVHLGGSLSVHDAELGQRVLPTEYASAHVELAYATTAHGAQGATAAAAHVVLDDRTTAASAYVGMTRGRERNVAHVIADDVDDAREQWVTAFSRNRADLGPAAASAAAARAAAGYAPAARPDDPTRLASVLDELRWAWSEQLGAHGNLEQLEQQLEEATAQAAWEARHQRILAPLEAERDAARVVAQRADQAAADCAAVLTARAEQHAAELRRAWDAQLVDADRAARTLDAGPGRLRVHRGRIRDAQQHLATWTAAWAPVFTVTALDRRQLSARPLAFPSNVPFVGEALYQHARRLAAADHPDDAVRLDTAKRAREGYDSAATAYHQARRELEQVAHRPVYDTGAADLIPELTNNLDATRRRVLAADQRVDRLSSDPAVTSQPDPHTLLDSTRAAWHADQIEACQQRAFSPSGPSRPLRHQPAPAPQIDHGPSIGR